MTIDVTTPAGSGRLETRLAGAFNVQNLLGVLGVLLESGMALRDALAALAAAVPPPGRMERLGGGAAADRRRRLRAHARCAGAGAVRTPARDRSRTRSSSACSVAAVSATAASARRWARWRDALPIASSSPATIRAAKIRSAIVADIVAGLRSTATAQWSVIVDRAAAIDAARRLGTRRRRGRYLRARVTRITRKRTASGGRSPIAARCALRTRPAGRHDGYGHGSTRGGRTAWSARRSCSRA